MLTNISNFYLIFSILFLPCSFRIGNAQNETSPRRQRATGTRSDLLAFSGSSKSELRKTQRSLAENNSESGRAHRHRARRRLRLRGSVSVSVAVAAWQPRIGARACVCVWVFFGVAAAAAETLLICCDGRCCCCCSCYQSIIVRLENVHVHFTSRGDDNGRGSGSISGPPFAAVNGSSSATSATHIQTQAHAHTQTPTRMNVRTNERAIKKFQLNNNNKRAGSSSDGDALPLTQLNTFAVNKRLRPQSDKTRSRSCLSVCRCRWLVVWRCRCADAATVSVAAGVRALLTLLVLAVSVGAAALLLLSCLSHCCCSVAALPLLLLPFWWWLLPSACRCSGVCSCVCFCSFVARTQTQIWRKQQTVKAVLGCRVALKLRLQSLPTFVSCVGVARVANSINNREKEKAAFN